MTIVENKILKDVRYPSIIIADDSRVQLEVIDYYRRLESILPYEELIRDIGIYLDAKYGRVEETGKYLPLDIEVFINFRKEVYRRCSCGWECPKDKSLIYHYCVRCGKLLPRRDKVIVLENYDYKQLVQKADKKKQDKKETSSSWSKIKNFFHKNGKKMQ